MSEQRSQKKRMGITVVGLAGAAAFIAVGALNLGDGPAGDGGKIMAGSGSAPADTTFVQPTENAMNMGATATFYDAVVGRAHRQGDTSNPGGWLTCLTGPGARFS